MEEQHLNVLYHSLTSMIDYQNKHDSYERGEIFSWFNTLTTNEQDKYLQHIPLSDLTISILSYHRINSSKINKRECTRTSFLSSTLFAFVINSKENTSSKKVSVSNNKNMRQVSIYPFDSILQRDDNNHGNTKNSDESNNQVYLLFKTKMKKRLEKLKYSESDIHTFLQKYMYFNILEEENEVSYNNRNSSKLDRTLFPLLYKKLSLRMRRTDGANDDDNVNNVNRALLQSFCNNAFISMLNEIPIQISRDGGNKYSDVNNNCSTSLVLGSFASFLALDICNHLLDVYKTVTAKEDGLTTIAYKINKSTTCKMVTIYKQMEKNRKLEILCSLTTLTNNDEFKNLTHKLEQCKRLKIFDIITSGTSAIGNKSDDTFINNLIHTPLLPLLESVGTNFDVTDDNTMNELILETKLRLHFIKQVQNSYALKLEEELLVSLGGTKITESASTITKKKKKKKKKKKRQAQNVNTIEKLSFRNLQKVEYDEEANNNNSSANYESDSSTLTSLSSSSTVTSTSSASCLALQNVLENDIHSMVNGLENLNKRRRALQSSIIIILHGIVSQLWPGVTLERKF
jgi:hypothetical protein